MLAQSVNWFRGLVKSIEGRSSEDMSYFSDVRCADAVGTDAPAPVGLQHFVPDECYLELRIESLRIEKARAFATTFHGIVYTFVTLNRDFDDPSKMAALTKPTALTDLDAQATGKVITLSKTMLGPIAWRGGDLGLELGLFSVRSGDLLSPFLTFLTRISETAGVSFVGAAKPFIPLISEGMGLLAGQTTDTKLEVGIDTSLRFERPMMCAIVAAPRDTFAPSDLKVDPSDRKLLANGKPVEAGYCVFSISGSDRKEDFGAIPELRDTYAAVRRAATAGDAKAAREAFASFRRATLLSQDLIPADAARLVAKAEALVAAALTPTQLKFAGTAPVEAKSEMPNELQGIDLY